MREQPWVELRSVRKSYGASIVLDGADTQIQRGGTVAIVGRSGSGKSTLLRLLGGLEGADSGCVIVGGQDLGTLNEAARARWRRRTLGFVFQFFNLIPTLSVAENIELPLALNGIGRKAAEQRVAALLHELDIELCGPRFPEEISGGEQQRAAIARALIHEPALVLADEPTGNLDLETAGKVLATLRASCARRNATLVVATHSAEAAAQLDRVLSIQGGRVLEMPR